MRGILVGEQNALARLSARDLVDRYSVFYIPPKSGLDAKPPYSKAIPLTHLKQQLYLECPDFILGYSEDEELERALSWPDTPYFKISSSLNAGEIYDHVKNFYRRCTAELGNFTYSKNPRAEALVWEILKKIKYAFKKNFDNEKNLTLLLVGGYGRGEGGAHPETGDLSNNLDLLLVWSRSSRRLLKKLAVFEKDLLALEKEYSIAIDLGTSIRKAFSIFPTKLFFYDLANGHKTLSGSDEFLKDSRFTDFRNIEDDEFLSLVINRSSLLLLNNWIKSKKRVEDFYPLMRRHLVKAVIAYGDYFLHSSGRFSWSYAEKLKIMRGTGDSIDSRFKELYFQCVELRFSPQAGVLEIENHDEQLRQTLKLILNAHFPSEKYSGKRNFKERVFARNLKERLGLKWILRSLRDLCVNWHYLRSRFDLPFWDSIAFFFLKKEQKIWILSILINFYQTKEEFGLGEWNVKEDTLTTFADVWGRWGDPNFVKLKNRIERAA